MDADLVESWRNAKQLKNLTGRMTTPTEHLPPLEIVEADESLSPPPPPKEETMIVHENSTILESAPMVFFDY